MKYEESRFINDDYMRLFTLLDRRTGKRTLEALREDYISCTEEELKCIYEIRFDAENIKYNELNKSL